MSPQRYIFRQQRRWYTSPFSIFTLMAMIIGGLFVTQGFRRGDVKPLFLPTATPTRIAESFAQEGETDFQSGSLDAAIASYQQAIAVNPQDGRLYAELARILTYSTESQTTDKEKQTRFDQALLAANKAVTLSPDDSTAFAVQAFTLDWYASFLRYNLQDKDQSTKKLTEAEQAISKAITLDETNTLAQVFRAEVMIDQERWDQAQAALKVALARDPNLWDAHRVNGLLLESQGYYIDSIHEFETAVKLAPNMTFLYIKLGMAWRNQGLSAYANPAKAKENYLKAIDYFAIAAAQNDQLGIKDPMPNLGIGRTYAQLGEFFAASINMNKALKFNPYNPDVYAQLGMVYRQARNYEDAILALRCAISGCKAEDTCTLRQCNPDTDPAIEITGMKLSGATVVYYYTYASLLAGMYLPRDPKRSTYCTDARALIAEIRASSYGNDSTINGILNESESICNSMTAATVAPKMTVTPTATGAPTRRAFSTPTPTHTPRPK